MAARHRRGVLATLLVASLTQPAAALLLRLSPAAQQPYRPIAARRPPLAAAPRCCDASASAAAASDDGDAGADVARSQGGLLAMDAPLPQIALCLAGYLVHVCFLSRRSLRLGPLSVGLDTLSGLAVLAAAARRRAQTRGRAMPPWLDGGAGEPAEAACCLDLRGAPREEKLRLLGTAAMVLAAPFAFSVLLGPLLEALPYALILLGVPLTEAAMPAARLLLEQSMLYVALLRLIGARHAPFFRGESWVRVRWRAPWLAPVLGGYAASLALFNLVEPINQALLPHLAYAAEGPVARLANPTDGSAATLLLSAITPCVGAPLYEELQSRAFLLQAMTAALPLRGALVASGVLFGAQHMQLGLLLPLSVTGFFWGVLYVHSGNLLVPMLIHALWNARIFLGSYLGL